MVIEEIMIHPVYNKPFLSSEHPEGEMEYPFDALGRDCMVVKFNGKWCSLYQGTGEANEDWYGYDAEVLAPFDGVVDEIYENPNINIPGHHNQDKAGYIIFKRFDGIRVGYGHVSKITVKTGETVKSGQCVARVGNNGTSYAPHIHIGAWKDNMPLQIRFDLNAMGRLMEEQGDDWYK